MPIIRKLTKVGHSYLIVIPLEIRSHLGVSRGNYLVWAIDKDGRVILEKLTPKKHPGFFIPGIRFTEHEK